MKKFIYLVALLGVVASCNFSNNQFTSQLEYLDSQLEQNPEMVWDSLKKMDSQKMSPSQQAYYYLLDASATDKNLVYLENDSTLRVALDYYEDQKDFYNLARCQYYLGKYTQKKQQTKLAYKFFKAAEENFIQSNSKHIHLLGLIYYRIGFLQKQQQYPEEAELFAQKSLKIFDETKDTISFAYSLRLISLLKINAKKFEEAKELLQKCMLLLSDIKDKSEKVFQVQNTVLSTTSYLYRKTGYFDKSLEYAKKSLSLYKKENRKIPSECYFNIALTYYLLNDTDSTQFYNNKLLIRAKEENNVFNLINAYKISSKLENNSGNYRKAYDYLKLINGLKDTLDDTRNKANLLELEKRYNDVKNQKTIYKAEKSKWQAYTISSLALLVIFLIGFPLYSHHRQLKLKYNQLSEAVKHTEWGFLVTKEFITENHIAYDELERILNREKSLKNINSELYNRFHEAIVQQKADYSGRLIDRLTSFDGAFAKKFQRLFPDFSTDELLMASMIHHKWKITDMTTIFHSSLEAIRKRKSRLSQKISSKLKKDIDLDDYLANL